MRTNCTNHPETPALAKGLCSACYMRQRRAAKSTYGWRATNGTNYMLALSCTSEWKDAFSSKIDRDAPNGCHHWVGTRNNGGYGVFYIADKTLLAHRLSFTLAGGNPTSPVVMHTCDNPQCVNPQHLSGGTYKDNIGDMDSKDRRVVGKAGEHLKDRAKHPRAKAVMAPHGQFASASLAADGTGLTAGTIARYCKNRLNGYSYI